MITASFARGESWDQVYRLRGARHVVPVEVEAFRTLLRTERFSCWEWSGGKRAKANVICCHGVMLDFDDGTVTIDEIRSQLIASGEHAFLAPSRNHRKDKPGKGVCDRFHVYLPFDSPVDWTIGEDAHSRAVYNGEFPTVDKAALDLARVLSPGEDFEVEWLEGKRFRSPYKGLEMGNTYPAEMTVKLASGSEVRVDSITAGKFPCHCPFHEDKTPSAFLKVLDDGRQMIVCSTCSAQGDGPWWLEQNGEAQYQQMVKRMFLLENRLREVMRSEDGKGFTVDFTPRGVFLDKDAGYGQKCKEELIRLGRKWPMGGLEQSYVKAGSRRPSDWYEWTPSGVSFFVPMADGVTQDNGLVDSFLDGRFGDKADFIRLWLAVYTYENFTQLPVLVLSGDRGAGKTTFSNMVASLYPRLSSAWNGRVDSFNDHMTGSLVVIDDCSSDKADLYVTLKTVTGSENIPINVKYGMRYLTRNNVNFVITSNDLVPLFLRHNEQADSERNNQWFFYEMRQLGEDLVGDMGKKLCDAMPHYARTRLLDIHSRWVADGAGSSCRYAIPTPITETQRDVFSSSMYMPDIEAVAIYEFLTSAGESRDMATGFIRPQFAQNTKKGWGIGATHIRAISNSGLCGKVTSSPKAIMDAMRRAGFLSKESIGRGQGGVVYLLVGKKEE